MSKLGVFDSGLGGFTIAQAIHQNYPQQDIVFLADQKNIPYGNREVAQLEVIIYDNMAWFSAQGIKEVILACNTTSVLPLTKVIHDFPHLKLIRIIDITVEQLKHEKLDEVIVLATSVTVASHAYKASIHKINDQIKVHEIAMSNLAHLIEAEADVNRIQKEIIENLSLYQNQMIPVLLGCTHYPLVQRQLKAYLGGKIYSSIIPIIQQQSLYTTGSGIFDCYTTGDIDNFQKQVKGLFDIDLKALKPLIK